MAQNRHLTKRGKEEKALMTRIRALLRTLCPQCRRIVILHAGEDSFTGYSCDRCHLTID